MKLLIKVLKLSDFFVEYSQLKGEQALREHSTLCEDSRFYKPKVAVA